MDVLSLARFQYAATTIFHFFFVPLSIGLVLIVSIMETMYVVKNNEIYKKMTQFWGKFFLINFAIGVVTGILQEFQFGMNWSEYSRFMGDVFGAPLAIEALLAFFMESTFIGLWLFGWDRLSKKVHLTCIWLVTAGTTLSALWILTANSFMQHPVGFHINNGRAEMNDFLALLTNPQLWVEFPHTIFGSFATGAFVVAGISAIALLKRNRVDFYLKSFKIAIVIGLVSGVLLSLVGHSQAQYLVKTQPMKMAASEGTWKDTADPAPWTVIANIDTKNHKNTGEIKIPYLLSFLSYGKFSGSVEGIETLQKRYVEKYGPGNYIPSVKTTFWTFRIMTVMGGLLCLLGIVGVFLVWRKKLLNNKWFLRTMVAAIAIPFIGSTTGWLMTEIGRQPWTVFGYMQTAASVSPNVSAGELLFSIIAFIGMYSIMAVVMIYLFVRTFKEGPSLDNKVTNQSNDPFDGEGYHIVTE
ncbi:cytochrome ubiquinol oxidase subunit I [Sporolactobacillus shoreicorticis]|uniref:Cytochrome ubiquinol oxidase subunit I n=1 Tax=Sporolactobacillus shoreicorticis TaxID=1923877 RepID=A0ABW5S4U8_9BACL|nr:cytochrome ubiquinol oxidase subunit I [Sporolactobacillus shoreicorticis]MCO7126214.1 cytochrome ubiquinol oxidase subunit I [Sporolactobacillus shoreicorticis]